ncbi:MAG: hypothetical protein RBT02_04585 [Bacteroidales bacterium]|nr:hypothetical protein [Bacteroidales bacterium]
MRYNQLHLIAIFFCTLMLPFPLAAQSWNFVKEKDSIKIYTRVEDGKTLRSYRGVTNINAPVEKVFTVMEDVYNTDWWDKKLTQIKVLLYEKDRKAQYYLVYDLPSPVTDRDLCVDVTVTIDLVTGERKIDAVSLNGVIPERKDKVRIKDYRQTWTIRPAGKETTHVILEGFVDPAGTIPEWISNVLIVESPLKAIGGLRERMERN